MSHSFYLLPGPAKRRLLGAALLLGVAGAACAQSRGSSGPPLQFVVAADVHPVFDIVETRRVPGGLEFRVVTNLREQRLNGVSYALTPGENILFVPAGGTRRGEAPVAELLY